MSVVEIRGKRLSSGATPEEHALVGKLSRAPGTAPGRTLSFVVTTVERNERIAEYSALVA